MNTPEQGQSKHNKKKMDQVKDRALGQVRHKDRALAVLEIPDDQVKDRGLGPKWGTRTGPWQASSFSRQSAFYLRRRTAGKKLE